MLINVKLIKTMSKKYPWLIILIIIILGVVVWVRQTDKGVEEREKEVVKVGAILPLSGVMSSLGQASQLGLLEAEKNINSQ